ncbi:leucine zipper protein 2 [Cricetulus griseus]
MPFFCVRQDYEELEKQLKEVFKERSTVLRQLTKTSRELDGIKVNLQVSWKRILSAAEDPVTHWTDMHISTLFSTSLGFTTPVNIYYYLSFERKYLLKWSRDLQFPNIKGRKLYLAKSSVSPCFEDLVDPYALDITN